MINRINSYSYRMREEEKALMECLSFYGPLLKEQLRLFFIGLTNDFFDRILNDLSKRQYIYLDPNSPYIYPDRFAIPSEKNVQAFWIFLKFLNSDKTIRQNCHCSWQPPAQMMFIKDNQEYEIIVLHETDIMVVNLLKKDEYYTKYIFGVFSEKKAIEIFKKCKYLQIENDIYFALMSFPKTDANAKTGGKIEVRFLQPVVTKGE